MWKQRLLEIALAGGLAAAAAGCGDNVPPCNGNSDPCCLDQNSQACLNSKIDMSVTQDAFPRHD
jgi:hypothetical protein